MHQLAILNVCLVDLYLHLTVLDEKLVLDIFADSTSITKKTIKLASGRFVFLFVVL